MASPIIVYAKSGSGFKASETVVPQHAVRADAHKHPDVGDWVGVIWAKNYHCRKVLEAIPGVYVVPPLHRPLKDEQVKLFAYAGAVQGDTGYDLAEKLHAFHELDWFHPEHQDYY